MVLLERHEPVFGAVLEAQLRIDDDKAFKWPAYAASVRTRFRCPVVVVVLTPYSNVALWAGQTIPLGGASVFMPVVIGPSVIPLVTDRNEAERAPELSVLSTLAHARNAGEPAEALIAAAVHGLSALPEDQRSVYLGALEEFLPSVLKKEILMLANSHGILGASQREAFAKGEAEGKAEGEAKALLRLLDRRGLALTDRERTQILDCRDTAQLEAWLDNVLTVASVAELIAE